MAMKSSKKTIHEWTYYMRYVYIYVYIYMVLDVYVYIYIMYITCMHRIRYMYMYIHIIYIVHIHTWGKSCRNTRSSEDQTQNPQVSCQEYPWKSKNLHTQKSIYPGTKNKNRQKRDQSTYKLWLTIKLDVEFVYQPRVSNYGQNSCGCHDLHDQSTQRDADSMTVCLNVASRMATLTSTKVE